MGDELAFGKTSAPQRLQKRASSLGKGCPHRLQRLATKRLQRSERTQQTAAGTHTRMPLMPSPYSTTGTSSSYVTKKATHRATYQGDHEGRPGQKATG